MTRPYEQLTINTREDFETTVLLLLVGIGVTELPVWGRGQQALASRKAGYLAGIQDAAESVMSGGSPTVLIDQVCEQLTRPFQLRRCEFDYWTGLVGGDRPRLRHDGQVGSRGSVRDVEQDGLPVDHDTELLVGGGSGYWGRFLLSATSESRPALVQRLVAVTLADQAASALIEQQPRRE